MSKPIRMLSLLALCIFVCHSGSAASYNFTVGPGGQPTYDYEIIQEAIDACDGDTQVDTITVYSGDYPENLQLKAYLTLQAAPGNSPRINPSSGVAVTIGAGKNNSVTVDGFTIDGGGSATAGIQVPAATEQTLNGMKLLNNSVMNINGTGIFCQRDYVGNLEISFNTISNCVKGLEVNGSLGSGMNKIENNLIVHNSNNGLSLNGSASYEILNNTIIKNNAGIQNQNANGDMIVRYCIIYSNVYGSINVTAPLRPAYDSCLQGSWAWGSGNIADSPLCFEEPGFRLSDGSPCSSAQGKWFPSDGRTEMGRYGDRVLQQQGGSKFTTTQTVQLELRDTAQVWTGAATYAGLSNDGDSWTVIPFPDQGICSWTLETGEGEKLVYYRPLQSDDEEDLLPGGSTIGCALHYMSELPIENLNTQARYGSIREALREATAGHTVEIQSSDTFNEMVCINKKVTLKAKPGCSPVLTSPENRVIQFAKGNLDDTVIQGLTLDGLSKTEYGIFMNHISWEQHANIALISNSIVNMKLAGIDLYREGLKNFTLAENTISQCGTGIVFGAGAATNNVIRNNLIYNNTKNGISLTGSADLDVFCYNNTLADNQGYGLTSLAKNNSFIRDSIIWGNMAGSLSLAEPALPVIYSCVEGGHDGTGNISADPKFVDLDDYHLICSSPCIDTGDPASDYSREREPNGGRVDMGRYGNTPESTPICKQVSRGSMIKTY